jgi:hypothetical protein
MFSKRYPELQEQVIFSLSKVVSRTALGKPVNSLLDVMKLVTSDFWTPIMH